MVKTVQEQKPERNQKYEKKFLQSTYVSDIGFRHGDFGHTRVSCFRITDGKYCCHRGTGIRSGNVACFAYYIGKL